MKRENESHLEREIPQQDKMRVLYSILIIIATLCIIAGVTYSIFQYQKPGENPNQVVTGTLILNLDESKGNAINMENVVPMSDAVGLTQSPYQFTLQNVGTLASSYKIRLIYDQTQIAEDNCGTKQLGYDQVRYQLVKDSVASTPTLLNTLNDYVIDAGTLLPGDENTYVLRMWLDQNITNPQDVNGKHFHVKLEIEGTQTNYPG